MVRKNVNFNNVEQVTLVEFGNKDVLLTIRESKEEAFLFMKSGLTEEIGSFLKKEKEFEPDIVLTFANTESIDVLIKMLKCCKELLDNKVATQLITPCG